MGNRQTLRGEDKGEGDKYIVDCWLLIVDWKNKNWIPVGVYT